MFFALSKLLWFFAAPSNLLLIALTVGVALLFTRRKRAGARIVAGALIAGWIAGSGPLGAAALGALEARFAPVAEDAAAPDGVIVLGGAIGEIDTRFGRQTLLTDAAERMTEGLAYARRWPQARLVFTGGSAALLGSDRTEAEAARKLWRALGVADGRAIFEDRSRNTHENATLTRDLVKPKAGERWLLVTSAHHMARAVGVFRRAGFDVVAAPVDFRVASSSRIGLAREWSAGLSLLDLATHEWIGLIAYRLSGKTDALLPGP